MVLQWLEAALAGSKTSGICSPGIGKRTRFYSEADRSIVGAIRCGVLFVMAFWSGTSRLAFAELKRSLEANDPEGRLELIVVDTDEAARRCTNCQSRSANYMRDTAKQRLGFARERSFVCPAWAFTPNAWSPTHACCSANALLNRRGRTSRCT